MLEIRNTKVYRGPNVWARMPVVRLVVALGELEDRPTNTIPGFYEGLTELIPPSPTTAARSAGPAASSSGCARAPGWATSWSTSPSSCRTWPGPR
jgi:hypothetical protein